MFDSISIKSSESLGRMSIKLKITGSITILMLLAFVALNVFNYVLSKNQIVNRIKEYELPAYTQNAKNEIIIKTNEGIKPLEIMINDSFFIEAIQNPDERTNEILNYLKLKSEKYNVIIGFISVQNSFYYSSTGKYREINPSSDAWYFDFAKSVKNENFNVGRSSDTRKISLFKSQKVIDDTGKFLGVAYIGMNINEIENFVLSRSFGQKSNVMMVSEKGKILIYKDSSFINVDNSAKIEQSLASLPGLNQLSQDLLSAKDKTMEYSDSIGDKKLVISQFIPQLESYLIMDISEKELTQSAFQVLIKSLGIGLVIFLIILFFMIFILNSTVLKPIEKILKVSQKFAEGNINTPISYQTGDEIGRLAGSMEQMRMKLFKSVKSITEGSQTILNAGNEIEKSSQLLSESANNQAIKVEEVLSSMEEMTANIHQNSLNSKQTQDISNESRQEIEKVQESFYATSEAMKQIASKIAIIKDIAFRTNLLALNASVEAARAGNAGRGFSIVAGEVKKLSEITGNAASEIDKLSAESVAVANQSTSLLANVVPKIQKTSELLNEISESGNEQAKTSDFINSAISRLNEIAQQNAASAEELASSSVLFIQEAHKLKEDMNYFKID